MRARIRGWIAKIRNLPRPTLVVLGLLILLLGAATVFGGYRAYDYTMNDPQFCRSCHTMEEAWDRWKTSEHRNVSCHNCHEQSIIASAEQVILFALKRPERVSKHAFVPDEACARCHESGNPQWKQVAETAGHKVHVERQNIACTKCHSVSIHRFKPPSQICAICHEAQAVGEKAVKIKEMSEFHCLQCHNYLREGSPLRPVRQTCLECHQAIPPRHTVGWPAKAPMQFACGDCHKPHEKAQPVVNCASCHQDALKAGLHTQQVHAATSCTTCHLPHAWTLQSRSTCQSCHTDKSAHYAPTLCSTCHTFRSQ